MVDFRPPLGSDEEDQKTVPPLNDLVKQAAASVLEEEGQGEGEEFPENRPFYDLIDGSVDQAAA